MTLHNTFVSLETGSPAYTRGCLAQSFTQNNCCQRDYSSGRNHAGTRCIGHKGIDHESSHSRITTLTT